MCAAAGQGAGEWGPGKLSLAQHSSARRPQLVFAGLRLVGWVGMSLWLG